MRNPLKRRTELERLEAELAGKCEQRARLVERLAAAEAFVAQARARVAELAPHEAADTQLDAAERRRGLCSPPVCSALERRRCGHHAPCK